jgi:macrolide transport system ATP-binding/permease protein
MLEHLFRDIAYGLRSMRRSPGFSLAAVLTMALGMGGVTAIFSVVPMKSVSVLRLGPLRSAC